MVKSRSSAIKNQYYRHIF